MADPSALIRPDLADRPHSITVEADLAAPPDAVYAAWTERFDSWFAAPGQVRMRAAVGEPFVFLVRHGGGIAPHYGRFLALEAGRLVELTWITGRDGTGGAETVVTVELSARGTGTRLRLTHAGFYDQAAADGHRDAWAAHVLPHLDSVLAATAKP